MSRIPWIFAIAKPHWFLVDLYLQIKLSIVIPCISSACFGFLPEIHGPYKQSSCALWQRWNIILWWRSLDLVHWRDQCSTTNQHMETHMSCQTYQDSDAHVKSTKFSRRNQSNHYLAMMRTGFQVNQHIFSQMLVKKLVMNHHGTD